MKNEELKTMKAIDYLKWHLGNGIEAGAGDVIDIDKDFDFESFFGYLPTVSVPNGTYVYLYGDMVLACDTEKLLEYNPYFIPTDNEDGKNGGKTIIYLFKLEE